MVEPDRGAFLSSSWSAAEVVLGVVSPVGTDVDQLERELKDRLGQFEYRLQSIRLSDLIRSAKGLETDLAEEPYAERLHAYMDAGNELRKRSQRDDYLALAAVNQIRQNRRVGKFGPEPCPRTAYFLRSLKHPEEVMTLREVYGRGFFLLGVSSPRSRRKDYLCKTKGVEPEAADALLERDESEDEGHGQQTRDAFHLADFFIALDDSSQDNVDQLRRVLDLLYGLTFLTPTREEYAMFLAYAASLRSADLSRQVGAIVVSEAGEIVSAGANDVPRAGGGLYWAGQYKSWPDRPSEDRREDVRDWVKGHDSNKTRRSEIIEDVSSRLAKHHQEQLRKQIDAVIRETTDEAVRTALSGISLEEPARADAEKALRGSPLMDLTEFGRAVHAEMEALLCCARSGVSTRNAELFCTTFPCHNCTKHIVAAGITVVHYIEPYPKSLAERLHGDAIVKTTGEEPEEEGNPNLPKKVAFRPFKGVGPRRFLDLFSLSLSSGRPVSRKEDVKKWDRKRCQLRVAMVPTSYLEREIGASDTLNHVLSGGSNGTSEE